MKILTWNVNGLRACIRHNGWERIIKEDPDIICFQEVKLGDESEAIKNCAKSIYKYAAALSSKKGRNGVCILSKIAFQVKSKVIGLDSFDNDGRFISIILDNGWQIIDLYMPHGKRDQSEIDYKIESFRFLQKYLSNNKYKTIICTDFNVAHKEEDVERYKYNYKNTMFTNDERKLIDEILSLGFCDAFRIFTKERGYYTWWPYGYNAKERNMGWRIDYFFVSNDLKDNIENVKILKEIDASDHSPMIMNISSEK